MGPAAVAPRQPVKMEAGVRRYVVRRVLLLIPTAFLATIIMFTMMKLLPGDVATVILFDEDEESLSGGAMTREELEEELDKIREQYGLNRPLPPQYIDWLMAVGRGELGTSYYLDIPVRDIVLDRFPRTFELALILVFLTFAQSIPLGVAAAVLQNTWVDRSVLIYSILGLSIPTVWAGVMFLFIFSRYVGWTPPIEWKGITEAPLHNLSMVLVPAVLVTFGGGASVIRMVRSQMLEVIRQDYIRTAYAKGLADRIVIFRHALLNAMLPVITQFGLYMIGALLGTVIVETLFQIPGMGKALVDAIGDRDYPVLQGLLLVNVGLIMIVNLLVDISYAAIDPRVRYS